MFRFLRGAAGGEAKTWTLSAYYPVRREGSRGSFHSSRVNAWPRAGIESPDMPRRLSPLRRRSWSPCGGKWRTNLSHHAGSLYDQRSVPRLVEFLVVVYGSRRWRQYNRQYPCHSSDCWSRCSTCNPIVAGWWASSHEIICEWDRHRLVSRSLLTVPRPITTLTEHAALQQVLGALTCALFDRLAQFDGGRVKLVQHGPGRHVVRVLIGRIGVFFVGVEVILYRLPPDEARSCRRSASAGLSAPVQTYRSSPRSRRREP